MYNTHNTAFFDDVLKASYARPVVVMFHASWCGPCKSMKPLVERLSTEIGFTLVGVDAGTERQLAASESVRAVPTLIVYKDGKAVGSPSAGAKAEAALRNYLLISGVLVFGMVFGYFAARW
jgi:putative thioredoxin